MGWSSGTAAMTSPGRVMGPLKDAAVADTAAVGAGIAAGNGVASVLGMATGGESPVGRTVSSAPHADAAARSTTRAKADIG